MIGSRVPHGLEYFRNGYRHRIGVMGVQFVDLGFRSARRREIFHRSQKIGQLINHPGWKFSFGEHAA